MKTPERPSCESSMTLRGVLAGYHETIASVQASLLIIAYLALSGCASSQPVIQVERIYTKTYIPAPATLTVPVSAIFPHGVTYGQALGIQQAAIQTCNANLAAIASLKPPREP